ncbi:uncharacterized protein si:dkey-165a24.9 isoform X2 [Phyllopteryx taeniolatus]|nr:uncharacterized protein si:dkey-165a24.9 isoform X2 [Phyllopteryx taeniolatus]
MPLWILYLQGAHRWPYGQLTCELVGYVFYVNIYASVMFLCLIALDRCLAIVFPLGSRRVRTVRVAAVSGLAAWTLTFLFCLLGLLPSLFDSERLLCLEQYPVSPRYAHFKITTVALGFLLPCAILGRQVMADASKRMAVDPGENFLHLHISNVRLSDTAMYYCGQSVLNVMSFDRGIFLLVRESGRPSVLQRPTSIEVSPGGSAAMNCTTHPGSSDGGQAVYWFRKASGDSHLLHVRSENGSECEKTTESDCVYTLSRRAVARADAGTYFCAVASCGEIVFGKGTRLDIGGEKTRTYIVSTHCLLASLLVSVVFNVFLTCLLRKKGRRDDLPLGEPTPQPNAPEDDVDHQSEDAAALPYVALDFKKRQSNTRRLRCPEDSVYAGLRLQHEGLSCNVNPANC